MNTLRSMIFMLVFMWIGIVFTVGTLDGLPRDDWTSAALKLGLTLTAVVVVIEVIFQGIRRYSSGAGRDASIKTS